MLDTHLKSNATQHRLRSGLASDNIDDFADWPLWSRLRGKADVRVEISNFRTNQGRAAVLRHIPAAALLFASALAVPANAQPAPAERAPAAAPLAPADNFGAIYGTGNLATPPAGMVPPPPTPQPGAPPAATPRTLLLRPEQLQRFQNERIQPPLNPIDYAGYVRESPLLRAFRKLQAEPTLDPALLVLLAWNHAALDMTSIDHTTAGQKTSFNGTMLSVFEPTYGEQFGPPRAQGHSVLP